MSWLGMDTSWWLKLCKVFFCLFFFYSRHIVNSDTWHPCVWRRNINQNISGDSIFIEFCIHYCTIFCLSRVEEALSDCIWALKHMRGNTVIDYRQLGLQFKLYSWQVWYSASTHTHMHVFCVLCMSNVTHTCKLTKSHCWSLKMSLQTLNVSHSTNDTCNAPVLAVTCRVWRVTCNVFRYSYSSLTC